MESNAIQIAFKEYFFRVAPQMFIKTTDRTGEDTGFSS